MRFLELFSNHQTHRVMELLTEVLKEIRTMSREVDNLKVAVQKNTEVVDSAVVLINGMAARFAELKADPVAIQALVDEIHQKAQALGNAVSENTPAE